MDVTTEEASKAVAGISVGSSTTQPEPGAQSKNALKKEIKLKQKEEERQPKEEEKAKKIAAVPSSQAQKSLAADNDDMDPTQYFENRLKALGALKAAGNNPYPHKFHVSMSVKEMTSFLLQQYFENRLKALGALKAAGNNPYPHKFHVLMSIKEYVEKYAGLVMY